MYTTLRESQGSGGFRQAIFLKAHFYFQLVSSPDTECICAYRDIEPDVSVHIET